MLKPPLLPSSVTEAQWLWKLSAKILQYFCLQSSIKHFVLVFFFFYFHFLTYFIHTLVYKFSILFSAVALPWPCGETLKPCTPVAACWMWDETQTWAVALELETLRVKVFQQQLEFCLWAHGTVRPWRNEYIDILPSVAAPTHLQKKQKKTPQCFCNSWSGLIPD